MIAIPVSIAVSVPVMIVVTPAVAVAVSAVTIPTMVMFKAPPVTVPVTGVELAAFIARAHPRGTCVWGPRPIPSVPAIMPADRIPVTVNPVVVRPWCDGAHADVARTRWRADSDTHCDLRRAESWGSAQQHAGKQCSSKKFSHHAHTDLPPFCIEHVRWKKFSPRSSRDKDLEVGSWKEAMRGQKGSQ